MSSLFPQLSEGLDTLAEQGLLRHRRTVSRHAGGWCEVDGRRLVDFASNDYLGLSHHPRVIEAASQAAEECGTGSGASALVVGRSVWHERLEAQLARFEGQEAAILFPTGYAANVGTITALVDGDDAIFSDRLNHASLIDGCRLSGAVVHIYNHYALVSLEARLAAAKNARRRLIVTDGVFSMDGVQAPLRELCALARRHDAHLLVDEAHATGVFGPRGRGTAELLGVEELIAVRVGTLSKAMGSVGGFVCGSRVLIDWLWNRARPQVFSTAAPPSACAAACTALEIIETEPSLRANLLALSEQFREGVQELGLETIPGGSGPIVPVILNGAPLAVRVAEGLEQQGYLVGVMRPPSVPEESSRLRITVSAAHQPQMIEGLLTALKNVAAAEQAA
ncbi:MAG TPA: 8-amino-7-oxononanoate synthase [Planctomycetaceae bacterium]|jgi:8-amino-7-oxononanoate synthase|nr:8-amino-7-oxononanoate synthase [Planctomycetaceae bacterium]